MAARIALIQLFVLLDAEAWREQFVDDVVVLLVPLLVLPMTSQLFVLNFGHRGPSQAQRYDVSATLDFIHKGLHPKRDAVEAAAP
jgi:hypothetical protein